MRLEDTVSKVFGFSQRIFYRAEALKGLRTPQNASSSGKLDILIRQRTSRLVMVKFEGETRIDRIFFLDLRRQVTTYR